MHFQCRSLLPIASPPLDAGWLEVDAGRIVRVGRGRPPGPAVDLGDVAVLPALVNAHTHLELSALAGRVGPAASLVEWIRRLLAERPRLSAAEVAAAASRAARAMADAGTALVGDISNTLLTPPLLAPAGLGGMVFHELLGFAVSDEARVVREAGARVDTAAAAVLPMPGVPALSFGLAAHAPYSTAPGLCAEIARAGRGRPLSIHLGESADELEFLRHGRGPFRELLEDLDVWNGAWRPPGCDPVEYLRRIGYLGPGLLAVHAVHVDAGGLDRLRAAGATVVACPRSNAWVGAGLPRVAHFYGAGVPVAIGTDSLASAPTLSVFDELAELRRIAPEVEAARLLESATAVGAAALGFGLDYGTLEAGKRAIVAAVDLPAGVTDVEEYLVSGVPPAAIRRLDLGTDPSR